VFAEKNLGGKGWDSNSEEEGKEESKRKGECVAKGGKKETYGAV